MKKYYYWSTEIPHKTLIEYFERFQVQYGNIPGIEIEDWTDTNGFLVRVPDAEAAKLPFNYPEGANPVMTRTEITELGDTRRPVTMHFVYRFDQPSNDLAARSKKAREDFQKDFGKIPGMAIVGFGESFFACTVINLFADSLPSEYQGMTRHNI